MEELTALIALGVAMNNSRQRRPGTGGGDDETGSNDDDDGDSDNEDNDSDVMGSGDDGEDDDDDDNDDMDNNKGGSGSNGEDNEERLNEEFNRLAAEVLDMLNKRDIQGEDIDNLKKQLKNGSVDRANFRVEDAITELLELKEDIKDFPEQVRDFPEQVPVKKAKPLGMFGRARVYIRGLNPFRRVQKTSADIAKLKKQLSDARTRNDQLEKDLKEKLKKCEEEKAALRTTNNDLTTANSALAEENKRLSTENDKLKKTVADNVSKKYKEAYEKTMKKKREELKTKEEELEALQKQLAAKEAELKTAQTKILELKSQQNKKAKEGNDVDTEKQSLREENNNLRKQNSNLKRDLTASGEAKSELEECQRQLEGAKERATDAETAAEEARSELKEYQDKLAEVSEAKEGLQNYIQQLQAENKNEKKELNRLLKQMQQQKNNIESKLDECNTKLNRKNDKITELEARIKELESDDQRESGNSDPYSSGETFKDGNFRVDIGMTGVGDNSQIPRRLPTAEKAKSDEKKSGNLVSESARGSGSAARGSGNAAVGFRNGAAASGNDAPKRPGSMRLGWGDEISENKASENKASGYTPNADNSSSAEDKLTPNQRTQRRNDSLGKLNLVFNKLKVKIPKKKGKFIRVQVMNSLQKEFDNLLSGRGKEGISTYIKKKKNEIEEKLENQNITKQALNDIDQDIENFELFNDEVDSKLEKVLEEMGEESEQGQTSGMVRRYSTRSSTTGLMSLRF